MKRERTLDQTLKDTLAKTKLQPSGCRVFTGCTNRDGYGKIVYFSGGVTQYWQVHRFVWSQLKGPIPDKLLVCHTCDNPPCVELSHLFLGTDADNARDKTEKGRTPHGAVHAFVRRPELVRSGTRHHNARLTPADVVEIRKLSKEGLSGIKIGIRFGISPSHAWEVATGRRWKTVPIDNSSTS